MAEELDLSGVTRHLRTPVYRYHQYQGETNDCGPTCAAIAANALLGEVRFQGAEVAREMNRPAFEARPLPHVVVRRVPNWATFPWGITHYLGQHGIPARWRLLNPVETLGRNLREDRISIVMLGQPLRRRGWRYAGWSHAKILFGHTPERGLLFVDPRYRRQPEADNPWARWGLFWQKEREFLRLWRGLGRICIEVGRGVG